MRPSTSKKATVTDSQTDPNRFKARDRQQSLFPCVDRTDWIEISQPSQTAKCGVSKRAFLLSCVPAVDCLQKHTTSKSESKDALGIPNASVTFQWRVRLELTG